MRPIILLPLCACLIGANSSASEPGFPDRPVRFIVPYPPGGGLDLTARIIGKKLNERWGHAVIMDNRGGASGAIGAELAARATPDGHTLLIINITFVVQPSLNPRLPYDLVRDFAPVINAVATPNIVVVSPSLPVTSVADLIALARKKPGQLTFAGGSVGGPGHLAGELFNNLARIKMIHVPYKGTALSISDLLGGRVDLTIQAMQTLIPLVRAGKLRALGITSLKRSPVLPDLPTVAEAGVAGYEFVGWQGIVVPSGTPRRVVDRLYSEALAALKSDDVHQLFSDQGAQIIGAGPEEFAAYIKSELKKWARVVAEAKIHLDTN